MLSDTSAQSKYIYISSLNEKYLTRLQKARRCRENIKGSSSARASSQSYSPINREQQYVHSFLLSIFDFDIYFLGAVGNPEHPFETKGSQYSNNVIEPAAAPETAYLLYSPTPSDLVSAEDYEARLFAVVRRSEAWCEFDPSKAQTAPVELKMARLQGEWDKIAHGDVLAAEEYVRSVRAQREAGTKLFRKLEKLMLPTARYLHPKQVASVLHAAFTITNDLVECISALQSLQWEKEVYLKGIKHQKGLD